MNEADYFIRMWNQAAGAMDIYQAETGLNMLFELILPMKPIVVPGVGEGAAGAALGQPPRWRRGRSPQRGDRAQSARRRQMESAG